MRNFKQLTPEEQNRAIIICVNEVCDLIASRIIVLEDSRLQSKIEKAFDKVDELETPWFIFEELMSDPELKSSIENLALDLAETAGYPSPLGDGSYQKVIQL